MEYKYDKNGVIIFESDEERNRYLIEVECRLLNIIDSYGSNASNMIRKWNPKILYIYVCDSNELIIRIKKIILSKYNITEEDMKIWDEIESYDLNINIIANKIQNDAYQRIIELQKKHMERLPVPLSKEPTGEEAEVLEDLAKQYTFDIISILKTIPNSEYVDYFRKLKHMDEEGRYKVISHMLSTFKGAVDREYSLYLGRRCEKLGHLFTKYNMCIDYSDIFGVPVWQRQCTRCKRIEETRTKPSNNKIKKED